MGIDFSETEGATSIDPDEGQGLIPALSTQAELNEFELLNIIEAIRWAERSRKMKSDLLRPDSLRLLHKRMFGKTWTWAGTYRLTQKSIGLESYRISTEMLNLIEDTKIWIQSETYGPAEIAARFHHRLVFIHSFPNGNGRHARLATDLLCDQNKWPRSDWGATNLAAVGTARSQYIKALQQADRHNLSPLIAFMTH